MTTGKTFIQALMAGETTAEEMWKWESAWQESYTHVPLHAALGLSEEELDVVHEDPSALEYVVQARKAGVETGFPVKTDDEA